jgi:hypothetical protein
MADDATMSLSATILPDEISKTLTSLSMAYTPADATEGWYYKLTDVTTSSADLIAANTYLQFGGTSQGEDTGSAMHTVATGDKVRFLFIKHTGVTDDGSTANTSDSIYLCLDAGTAAHDLADAIEIGPNESWYGKFNGVTVADIHCISGQIAGAGTGGNKIQCIVAAIIDNV